MQRTSGSKNADGFVEVDQLKQWFKELEPYGEMRPVLDFIGQSRQQLLAQFVELSEVAKHMQPRWAGESSARVPFAGARQVFGGCHTIWLGAFSALGPTCCHTRSARPVCDIGCQVWEEIIGMMTRRESTSQRLVVLCTSAYLSNLPPKNTSPIPTRNSFEEYLKNHGATMYIPCTSIGVA